LVKPLFFPDGKRQKENKVKDSNTTYTNLHGHLLAAATLIDRAQLLTYRFNDGLRHDPFQSTAELKKFARDIFPNAELKGVSERFSRFVRGEYGTLMELAELSSKACWKYLRQEDSGLFKWARLSGMNHLKLEFDQVVEPWLRRFKDFGGLRYCFPWFPPADFDRYWNTFLAFCGEATKEVYLNLYQSISSEQNGPCPGWRLIDAMKAHGDDCNVIDPSLADALMREFDQCVRLISEERVRYSDTGERGTEDAREQLWLGARRHVGNFLVQSTDLMALRIWTPVSEGATPKKNAWAFTHI
jgi:hypothetical protein